MNKDMYKRTFEAIKPSNDFIWKENSSHKKRQHLYIPRPALAAVIALAIVTSGSGVAYAANIAGFRDVVKIWFGGDYVESSIEETGDGQFTVTNPDGEFFVVGGFDEDGKSRTRRRNQGVSGRRLHLRRDRRQVCGASGRLHPRHPHRAPPGRRRRDGSSGAGIISIFKSFF